MRTLEEILEHDGYELRGPIWRGGPDEPYSISSFTNDTYDFGAPDDPVAEKAFKEPAGRRIHVDPQTSHLRRSEAAKIVAARRSAARLEDLARRWQETAPHRCACGCGVELSFPKDEHALGRRYIRGHNNNGGPGYRGGW